MNYKTWKLAFCRYTVYASDLIWKRNKRKSGLCCDKCILKPCAFVKSFWSIFLIILIFILSRRHAFHIIINFFWGYFPSGTYYRSSDIVIFFLKKSLLKTLNVHGTLEVHKRNVPALKSLKSHFSRQQLMGWRFNSQWWVDRKDVNKEISTWRFLERSGF